MKEQELNKILNGIFYNICSGILYFLLSILAIISVIIFVSFPLIGGILLIITFLGWYIVLTEIGFLKKNEQTRH